MANSPPLPAGYAPTMPGLPPGTTIKTVSPFPPELEQQLQLARRSGSYCITITIHDPLPNDDNRITCYMSRSKSFSGDWLLRMWRTIAGLILSDGVKTPLEPAPAPIESASARG